MVAGVGVTKDLSSRWTTMVIIFLLHLLFTSQGHIQELTSEQSHQNTTAVVGQSVTLACGLTTKRPATKCSWFRYQKGSTQKINSSDHHYISDQSNKPIKFCFLRIAAVTQDDFGQWTCVATRAKYHRPEHSQRIWITERVTPSSPLIRFNNRIDSVIGLPSPDPPSRMVCKSESGNPPPQMHWEVSGIKYLGRVETTYVHPHRHTVQLHWDTAGGWHVFDDAEAIACIAQHPGFTNHTSQMTVQFNRKGQLSAGGPSVEHSHEYLVIIAGVLGAMFVINVVILTVVVVRSRRLLMNRKLKSVTPLPSLAELNRVATWSTINTVTEADHHNHLQRSYPSTSSFSNYLSEDDDDVQYVNVDRKNTQSINYDMAV